MFNLGWTLFAKIPKMMVVREIQSQRDSNMTPNEAGRFECPKCRGVMVPMAGGKGWRCGKPGNVYRNGRWSLCDGITWNKSNPYAKKNVIERPINFPQIKRPTVEQIDIRDVLSKSPSVRGGRLLIVNAGPGCGKSTTMGWASEAILNRVGNVGDWHMCAFGVNARESLESKMPTSWANIATINGFGGRIQGYNAGNYKINKLQEIFKLLVDHIPYKERPGIGACRQFIERMRDLGLYNPDPNNNVWWNRAIDTCATRFPGLQKQIDNKFMREHVTTYVPQMMVRAHADKSKIDLSEQYTRPVLDAIVRSGWELRPEMVDRSHEWTDDDVKHFCSLIKKMFIRKVSGVIVDEGQDLSLSQIALFIACTWNGGELVVVGDDREDDIHGEMIKAGQGIFGWRGAFPGSLHLISRIWGEMTGEEPITRQLTMTHRIPPEVVEAIRPLSRDLRSSKPIGSGSAMTVSPDTAWTRWIANNDDEKAFWITRTNAPLSGILLGTIKEKKKCMIRGNNQFNSSIDGALYNCAGWYDSEGEFKTDLKTAIANLEKWIADNTDPGKPEGENDLENFVLDIMNEINIDPSIVCEIGLNPVRSVGNVRRFIMHYSSNEANRVISTVYRIKGEEAPLVIVSDTDKFSTPWNEDVKEMYACIFVACSRSAGVLLTTGGLPGVRCQHADDFSVNDQKIADSSIEEEEMVDESSEPEPIEEKPEPIVEQPKKKRGRPPGTKNKPKK